MSTTSTSTTEESVRENGPKDVSTQVRIVIHQGVDVHPRFVGFLLNLEHHIRNRGNPTIISTNTEKLYTGGAEELRDRILFQHAEGADPREVIVYLYTKVVHSVSTAIRAIEAVLDGALHDGTKRDDAQRNGGKGPQFVAVVNGATMTQNPEAVPQGPLPAPCASESLMPATGPAHPGCWVMTAGFLQAMAQRYRDLAYHPRPPPGAPAQRVGLVCGLSHPFIHPLTREVLFDWKAFFYRISTAGLSPIYVMSS